MSADAPQPASPPEAPPPANWRFHAGVGVLIVSCIMPFCALVVPFLGLDTGTSAMLAGGLAAGVPEILSLVSIALMGRENFNRLVGMVKNAFIAAVLRRPASRTRYYIGLAACLLSIVPLYLYGYAPHLMPEHTRVPALIAGDVVFILSLFVMGGEFWAKFRRLVVWEGTVPDA